MTKDRKLRKLLEQLDHPGLPRPGRRQEGMSLSKGPKLAEPAAPAHVPQQPAQEALRRFELLVVARRQPLARRIEPPPTLEAPHALIADAQPRDALSGAARIAGLRIEEALEDRLRGRAVRLAFAAVEDDDRGRARARSVRRRRPTLTRSATSRAGTLAAGRWGRLGP